jgi:hypothetical protein
MDEDLVDEIERVLKSEAERDILRNKFIDDLIRGIGDLFITYRDEYSMNREYFIEKSLIHIRFFGEDFFETMECFEDHYAETDEKFLDYDITLPKGSPCMTQEEIDKYKGAFPNRTQECLQESIDEINMDRAYEYEYETKSRNAVKKVITKYLRDIDNLPGVAFRELEFLAFDIHFWIENEMFSLVSKLEKESKQNVTI